VTPLALDADRDDRPPAVCWYRGDRIDEDERDDPAVGVE